MSGTTFKVTPDEEVHLRARSERRAAEVFKEAFGLDTTKPEHPMRVVRREGDQTVYACRR